MNILDLKSVRPIVESHLKGVFSEFPKLFPCAEVSAIEVRFDTDPGGYFVNIDTRDQYLAGTWDEMEFCDYAFLLVESWGAFKDLMRSEGGVLTTCGGVDLVFEAVDDGYKLIGECDVRYESEDPDGGNLAMAVGELLTLVMKGLADERIFDDWKLRNGARFYVNETTHVYHTPFHSESTDYDLVP